MMGEWGRGDGDLIPGPAQSQYVPCPYSLLMSVMQWLHNVNGDLWTRSSGPEGRYLCSLLCQNKLSAIGATYSGSHGLF